MIRSPAMRKSTLSAPSTSYCRGSRILTRSCLDLLEQVALDVAKGLKGLGAVAESCGGEGEAGADERIGQPVRRRKLVRACDTGIASTFIDLAEFTDEGHTLKSKSWVNLDGWDCAS